MYIIQGTDLFGFIIRICFTITTNLFFTGVAVRRIEQVRWCWLSPAWTVWSYWPVKSWVGCSRSPANVRTTEQHATTV